MTVEKRNQILSIVLGVIILGLFYWLYDSIVGPYQKVIEQQAMTERVRHNMENVRDALQQYKQNKGEFPPSEGGLDSLTSFLKSDSLMIANGDSLFKPMAPDVYNPDSLIYSPRPPHKKFQYALNDSSRPPLYLLEDPDSDDKIGSLEKTTLLNAATWE